MKRPVFSLLLPGLLLVLGSLTASSLLAQAPPRSPQPIQPTAADDDAAASSVTVYTHAFAAKTDAGAAFKHSQALTPSQLAARGLGGTSEGASFEGNDQLRFPGDLINFFGGPTVPFAQSHPIFLLPNNNPSCTANACWGDPETFLALYGFSGLSHVTDQYVGTRAGNRYTLGDDFPHPYTPTPKTAPLTDADIRAYVHAAAAAKGETGLNHIFHVFLPPGQDECLNPATCYSPDVPATFAFCAYHSHVNFKNDIGLVLYTVEPFQNVLGCQVRQGTPNGQLIDSTNSTLSHELTETITDPDGNAWFNLSDGGLEGEEIGDECDFFVIQPFQVAPGQFVLAAFGDPTTFSVGKHIFATQPEYSNEDHACAIRP